MTDVLGTINSWGKHEVEEFATAVIRDKKIDAIKVYRIATGHSLKQGFDFITANWAELRKVETWRKINGK